MPWCLAALEVEQAECVADDDQGGAFVDEHDRADVQAEEGGEDEERDDREAGDEVLPDDAAGGAAEPHSERDAAEVVAHQRDVAGLQRDGGAGGAHRDADVGAPSRGVVDAVADHRDRAVGFGEAGDLSDFVLGEQLADRGVDADFPPTASATRWLSPEIITSCPTFAPGAR
jgi:hypothetical protein